MLGPALFSFDFEFLSVLIAAHPADALRRLAISTTFCKSDPSQGMRYVSRWFAPICHHSCGCVCGLLCFWLRHISPAKGRAAACFAVLNLIPIPIPLVPVILPAVGLYICLMDDSYDRGAVNKVFGLTFLFAVLGVLLVYRL